MRLAPKVAPSTIVRDGVTAWLKKNAHMPVRFLLAPSGSGKTTALADYATSSAKSVAYIHLTHDVDESRLLEAVSQGLGFSPTSAYQAVHAGLDNVQPSEIIIDGIDHVSEDGVRLLERFVLDGPAHVTCIYAGSKSCLRPHTLAARGLASIFPSRDWMFSYEETITFAKKLEVSATPQAIEQVLSRTDGWPIVVGDVLRTAAEANISLIDAYERWLTVRGQSFSVYIDEAIAQLPEAARSYFMRSIHGESLTKQQVQELEDHGAFVIIEQTGCRPFRVLEDISPNFAMPYEASVAVPAEPASGIAFDDVGPIMIRMFGRFSVRRGNREVNWVRRRDQQLFRYLALRPQGRTTKTELTQMFWPEADSHLASQSLRTACSNIRKALTEALDLEFAERLFKTEGQEICVNLDGAVFDVARFKAHINAGNLEDDENNLDSALAHYHAADKLYRSDLFGGEPAEAWFLPQRDVYNAMHEFARERIAVIEIELTQNFEESSWL